jgi:hypothetical protein
MLDKIKVKGAARRRGVWTEVAVAGSKPGAWIGVAVLVTGPVVAVQVVWVQVAVAEAIASATEVPVLVLQGAGEPSADPQVDRLGLAVRAALPVWDLAAVVGAGGNRP